MNRGGDIRNIFCAIIVCILWGTTGTCPVSASITTTGNVGPAYDGNDPWVVASDVVAGGNADGSILVSGGSQVQVSYDTVIASGPGVTGGVTVTGTGSVWDSRNWTNVGEHGNGTMTIENVAHLVSRNTTVGSEAGSVGHVLVTGPGTTWEGGVPIPGWPSTFGGKLRIGNYGVGEVIVSNGAKVTADWVLVWVGLGPDSAGSLTVTDPDSVWENGGDMLIGNNGTGSLLISNGGTVTNAYSVGIGPYSGAHGSATVTGLGSSWRIHEGLLVGGEGHGTLLVTGGGRVESGYAALESASVATITGPGSTWENAGSLTIDGNASLTISDGGRVEGDYLRLMWGSLGPASVTVTGADSVIQMTNWVAVSGGSRLEISDGGRVTDALGSTELGGGGIICVTGPGSQWVNTSSLILGENTDLTISAGGSVSSASSTVQPIYGTSSVTVTGAGSLWDNQAELLIGYRGNSSLLVTGGGRVTSGSAYVEACDGGTAVVTITGPDSRWTNTGTLAVGDRVYHGPLAVQDPTGYGTINVSNGGVVETHDMAVWEGSILSGDGTFKATQITNDGIIRPGNSIGTLTIDGDLTMEPNSVLETEIDNSGHGDKLAVTGDVSIVGGTVKAMPTETITQSRQYTIVEANSVAGMFDTVVLPDAIARTRLAMLSYEPDSVSLTVTPFDRMLCLSRNQQAVGTALQTIADVGPTPVTAALQRLPTLDAVRAAYDQLSGQSRPALAPIAATDSAKFMGIVSNRLQGARGVVADNLDGLSDSPLLAMASSDGRVGTPVVPDVGWGGPISGQDAGPHFGDRDWGIWAKAYGLYGDRDTEHGTPGYAYNVFGQSFGIDIQFTERFVGGLTGGYSSSQVDYDRLADRADIDTTHAGLYGSYSGDGWYLNYVATHSWLNLNTLRVVDLTGERHKGSFDGHEWSGYFEAGFDWQPAPTWLVQPLAGLQVTSLHLDQYAEEGLASALVFEEQDYESYKASVGARVTKELILGSHGRAAIVQGRARWVHEFGDVSSSVNARFEDVPTVWFKVSDEEVSRDTILLGTGIGVRLTKGLRAFVDYDASLNADNTAHVISGAVEYRW